MIKNLRTHFGLLVDLKEYIDKVAYLPGVGIARMVEEEKALASFPVTWSPQNIIAVFMLF